MKNDTIKKLKDRIIEEIRKCYFDNIEVELDDVEGRREKAWRQGYNKALKDVEDIITEAMPEIKKDVIRDIRKWTKGRNVTKESLRSYLNKINPDNCDHEPQIVEVTEDGHTFHVNGDVCVKCQQLL